MFIVCNAGKWKDFGMIASSFFLLNLEPDTCNHKDFTCANGECISSQSRCDGNYDCLDNSDEASIFFFLLIIIIILIIINYYSHY